jgi:hypothetical protein
MMRIHAQFSPDLCEVKVSMWDREDERVARWRLGRYVVKTGDRGSSDDPTGVGSVGPLSEMLCLKTKG